MQFGRRYSPFKAKSTLIIFGILLISGIGSQYLSVGPLSLLALPANLVYSQLMQISGLQFTGIMYQAALAGFYYVFAVIVGFAIHTLKGSNDPLS